MYVRYGVVEAAFTITSVNDHDAAKTHASKVRLLKHYMHLHALFFHYVKNYRASLKGSSRVKIG